MIAVRLGNGSQVTALGSLSSQANNTMGYVRIFEIIEHNAKSMLKRQARRNSQ